MNNIVNCNFKIDKMIKTEFDNLCTTLGLTMSAAINMFIKQSIITNGLPLNLNYQNDDKVKKDIQRKILNMEIFCSQHPGTLTDKEISDGWQEWKRKERKF